MTCGISPAGRWMTRHKSESLMRNLGRCRKSRWPNCDSSLLSCTVGGDPRSTIRRTAERSLSSSCSRRMSASCLVWENLLVGNGSAGSNRQPGDFGGWLDTGNSSPLRLRVLWIRHPDGMSRQCIGILVLLCRAIFHREVIRRQFCHPSLLCSSQLGGMKVS